MTESLITLGVVSWEDKSTNPPTKGEILVKPNRTVLVGRDEANNDVVFLNPIVSGCQFEIYSLIVDEEDDHPPIVFIRDRGSANGTCVNGQLIGKRPMVCQGRVLDDGDIITVGGRPDLTFTYTQVQPVRSSYTLSPVQRKEVKVFENRFVIDERTIGHGGHALVFLARDIELGEHAVCKVHDISNRSPTSREVRKIRQEAALMSALDHPNILPFKAAFETRQTIYIFTHFATGGDLYSLVLRYDTIEEVMVRSIIRQILRGLTYIHSKGVAHRDIKPENILCGITPRAPYRIMLSDFGDSAAAGRKRMMSCVGTRFYRAPECRGSGDGYDLSADIWAVGVVALQLLYGYEELPGIDSGPFDNQEEVKAYIDMVFADLSARGRDSEAGKDFIRACLAYDSKMRPTALEAFHHVWLQTPEADKRMFDELEAENVRSWKPQPVKLPVIEDLMLDLGSMSPPASTLTSGGNTP